MQTIHIHILWAPQSRTISLQLDCHGAKTCQGSVNTNKPQLWHLPSLPWPRGKMQLCLDIDFWLGSRKLGVVLGMPPQIRSIQQFEMGPVYETCDWVSTLSMQDPVWVFQNFMHRSAVPPPEASRCDWKGHHARALTAAWCSSKRWRHGVDGCSVEDIPADDMTDTSQMWRRLSLPPLASCWPDGAHLRPQTSWLCPTNCEIKWSLIRTEAECLDHT